MALHLRSEIKPSYKHPAVTAEVTKKRSITTSRSWTTPAPQTLFRGIQKIPAGTCWWSSAMGEVRLTQYWDALPPESAVAGISEEEHQQRILELLRESIKKRMMADVPFGVFSFPAVSILQRTSLDVGIDDAARAHFHGRLSRHGRVERVWRPRALSRSVTRPLITK